MELDEMEGPAHPAHPDHRDFIVQWTRSAAASEVIIDPKRPNPPTPEQLAMPVRSASGKIVKGLTNG